MRIRKRNELPKMQQNREVSMWVFIYHTDNTHFGFGRYNFEDEVWEDEDSIPIRGEFLWSYLPVKAFKRYMDAINRYGVAPKYLIEDEAGVEEYDVTL